MRELEIFISYCVTKYQNYYHIFVLEKNIDTMDSLHYTSCGFYGDITMEKKFYGVSLATLLVVFVLVSVFLVFRELVPYLMGSGFTPFVISTPFAVVILTSLVGWISIKWTKLVLKFFKEDETNEDE